MTIETKYADGVVTASTITNPANVLGAPDGVFTGDTGDLSFAPRYSIADPVDNLTPEGAVHTVTVTCRKDAAGGTDPTLAIQLYDNGAFAGQLSSTTITDATTTVTGTFTTDQAGFSGSKANIQILLNITASSGPPAGRHTVQVDAISVALDTSPPAFGVDLNWNDNTEPDFSYYRVYRRAPAGSYTTPLASPTVSNYRDRTALQNGEYYYVVRAVDTAGNESGNSTEVHYVPTTLPRKLVGMAGIRGQW